MFVSRCENFVAVGIQCGSIEFESGLICWFFVLFVLFWLEFIYHAYSISLNCTLSKCHPTVHGLPSLIM